MNSEVEKYLSPAQVSKPKDLSPDVKLLIDVSTPPEDQDSSMELEWDQPAPKPKNMEVDASSISEEVHTTSNQESQIENEIPIFEDSSATEEHASSQKKNCARNVKEGRAKYQKQQTAKRSGQAIQNKVKDYIKKTGAKAYFQAEFKGDRMSHTYTAGKYWNMNSSNYNNEIFTKETLIMCVKAAVRSELASMMTERGMIQLPLTNSSGQDAENKDNCIVCNCSLDSRENDRSVAIACSGDVNGHCEAWIHGHCLGFPGLLQRQIKKLPDYFCPFHLSRRNGDSPDNLEGH